MAVNTTNTRSRASGSMKDPGRSQRTVSVNRNSGSIKTLYSSQPKSEEEEKQEEEQEKGRGGSAAGSMKDVSRNQRPVYVNPNSGSMKSLYSTNPNSAAQPNDDKTINISDFYKADKALVTSPKTTYNSAWAEKPEETLTYTLDDIWPRKPPEERVNIAQLIYGLGEQAANEFVGNALSTMDMFIGTPWQKAWDYAEEKLGLPDTGVNWLTAYNKKFQEEAAREAEYYAQNAAKSELASFINEYGPDVIAMIPEIALAFASGGTSAAASAGAKGISAASKLSKADNVLDGVKRFGKWISNDAIKDGAKWVKNNPNAAMNFLQTTGSARNQALSEGASGTEANLYALTNGVTDALISKYGVGAAQKGIESLPENLQNAWKKVSNTVKSADAAMQEILEEQMYDVTQRAARGIYDEDAKLFSLSDENAVFNPKSMLESALMGSISPLVMGEIDTIRTKGTPEPARVKVDKETKRNSNSKEGKNGNKVENHNTGSKAKAKKQDPEQDPGVKKILGGNVLNSKEVQKLDMKDPAIQKLISEKSGIPISRSDNANKAVLRQKFQFAAMEIAKKNAQENESASKRSIEKAKEGTYNKSKGRK
ncbi:MAG: hypothetical protein IJE09_00165 [Oscillospiraceae bacterium]|nr:hypothetical protein [Oscillospiraceae bacterium]